MVLHSRNKQNLSFFHQRHNLHKHSSFSSGAWKCSPLHEAPVPSCKYRGASNNCVHHLSGCLRAHHTGSKPVLYFDFIFSLWYKWNTGKGLILGLWQTFKMCTWIFAVQSALLMAWIRCVREEFWIVTDFGKLY